MNVFLGLRSGLSVSAEQAISDEKSPNWLTKPKKDLKSVMFLGEGKLRIASNFLGSASMP